MNTRISTRNRDKVVQLGSVGAGEAQLNLASAVQSYLKVYLEEEKGCNQMLAEP